MKINRADLLWFLNNIRRKQEGKELNDETLKVSGQKNK